MRVSVLQDGEAARTVKAVDLSGVPNLLFRQQAGTVAVPPPTADPNVPEVEGEMEGG